MPDDFGDHGFGIHHRGSLNEVMEGYAKASRPEFLDTGFGSDIKRCRHMMGPDGDVNARICHAHVKDGTSDEAPAKRWG